MKPISIKINYVIYLIASLIFISSIYIENSVLSGISKPIPILILILQIKWDSFYNKMIILGLVLSLIGDILLLKSIDIFIMGLVAFLIAHLFYIIGFMSRTNKLVILTCIPFYLYGIIIFIFLHQSLGELAIPVAVYMFVITTMLWRSFIQRNTTTISIWAFWGALLFTLSDSIIAISKFYKPFYLAAVFIMLAYYGGQFMIYWSSVDKNPASV